MTVYFSLLECDTNNNRFWAFWLRSSVECDTNKTQALCVCQLGLLYSIEHKCVGHYTQTPSLVLGISPTCAHQKSGQWYSLKGSEASY